MTSSHLSPVTEAANLLCVRGQKFSAVVEVSSPFQRPVGISDRQTGERSRRCPPNETLRRTHLEEDEHVILLIDTKPIVQENYITKTKRLTKYEK